MKLLNKLFYTCSLVIFLASCQKDEDLDVQQPIGLGGDTTARGSIDRWLLDSLTKPYNISVKYRWDPFEVSLFNPLTPPDESKVIAAMSAVKRVWIDPYNAETGNQLFIKKYSPKQFVLVGSVEYQPNGTVILGQAEGGNTITFFDINQNYDNNNVTSIRRMIQTSHHEFAHILHQNVMYPQEYKYITSNLGLTGYTSTWFNVFEDEALENGYITPYAMASPDEDFVEMIANMLMEGRQRFDEIVASVNPSAQSSLRAKEQIVVEYFRKIWKIDFYSLQNRVQAALNALVPPPAVVDVFGFGKTFTTASVDPADQVLLPQPSAFMTLFNSAKTGLAALAPTGRVLDSFSVIHNSASSIILELNYHDATTTSSALYQYAYTRNGNLYTFTLNGANPNGGAIYPAVKPLVDYFTTGQFTIDWYRNPTASPIPRVKFTPQSSPGSYFYARLLP